MTMLQQLREDNVLSLIAALIVALIFWLCLHHMKHIKMK